MVQFTSTDKKDLRYARLIEFLPQALKDFYADPDKLQKFLKYSRLTSPEAEKVLAHIDSDPTIDILYLDGEEEKALGKFTTDTPRHIVLNANIALRFNEDYENESAQKIVLATILHECVHYSQNLKQALELTAEDGRAFAKEVWDSPVDKAWFESTDFKIPEIANNAAINIRAGILAAAPNAPESNILAFENIKHDLLPYNILENKNRLAHLIGQCAHESSGFTKTSENLRYTTTERLMKIFKNKFTNSVQAQQYLNDEVKLANYVYASKYGNGSENSGDGYRFRGRGYIHLTFKDNYRTVGNLIHEDLIASPEKAENPEIAWRIAVCFLATKKDKDFGKSAFEWADENKLDMVTKIINGGENGIYDRKTRTLKALLALNGIATPILRIGDRGESVVELQNKLDSSGFYLGPSDGDFDLDTDRAVRDLQKAKDLKVDGIVGYETWAALYSYIS